MTLKLSDRAITASRESDKEPQLLVKIDGIDNFFTTTLIGKYWKIGDVEVILPLGYIGLTGLTIGGVVPIAGQKTLLSFDAGTTTTLQQQLNVEDGTASVSSMQLGFIDSGNQMTEIISPSVVLDDILARGVEVFFGFGGTGYPEDFVKIHQGVVDEVVSGAGIVQMNVSHPEQLKRQDIYIRAETTLPSEITASTSLSADINDSVTTIPVGDTSAFPLPTNYEAFIKIGDEIIRYTGATPTSFTGCTRGVAFTTSAAHTASDAVDYTYKLTDTATEVYVKDATQFIQRVLGPNGTYDSGFGSYVVIDDEVIKYTTITGNKLQGVTRGQLGTTAAVHDADAGAKSLYRFTGTMNDIVLKLYHSYRGAFFDQLEVENFVYIDALLSVSDAVFFKNVDLADYGIYRGQYLTISGSSNGNNGTWIVEQVVKVDNGSYVTVVGHDFNLEVASPATCSFRSQWDVWPEGCAIHPKFVDLERHDFVNRTFLSSFNYDFYIKDTIQVKDFVDKEVYVPAGAYSLPRGGQISLGYNAPPIPSVEISIVDKNVIKNPDELQIKRSLSKAFYNGTIVKFDEHPIKDDFYAGTVVLSATSQNRIPIGNRLQTIEAKGLRSSSQGLSQSLSSSLRKLNRYQFGAEYIENLELFFELVVIEAGDIVLMDFDSLQISNTVNGTRVKESKLFEVIDRTIDIQNGTVDIEVLDTNFSTALRYCIISPSSKIKHSASQKQFTIESSFASQYGDNEYRKWEDWIGAAVVVRSADSVTRYGWSVLQVVAGNTITLAANLGFTPQTGDIMEFYKYDNQSQNVVLIYGFMHDPTTFADGKEIYSML